jgi:hypothetical protein
MTKDSSANSRRVTRSSPANSQVWINRGLVDSAASSMPMFSFPSKVNGLNDEFNAAESRRLLKTMDEMRELLHHEKISLPQIVVVGDQSASEDELVFFISFLLDCCFTGGQIVCSRSIEWSPTTARTEHLHTVSVRIKNERYSARCKRIRDDSMWRRI